MNSIYWSDSQPDKGIDPEAVAKLQKRLSNPAFRYPKLVSGMSGFLPPEAQALIRENRKSYPANTIIGENGLTYAVAELMEYGYGIFSGWLDDEYMLTWLGPQLYFQSEQLIFKVWNWTDYLKNVGQRGSSTTWDCAVGSHSDVPVGGCEFNYCFEPNRFSKFGVPAGTTPLDLAKPNIVQPTVNVLGTRITDRVQLREYSLMMGLRVMMLDRLFTGDHATTTVGDNGQEDGLLKWFDNWTSRHAYLSTDCKNNFGPTVTATPTTYTALGNALGHSVPNTAADIQLAQFEWLAFTISQQMQKVEWLVAEIGGGNEIPFDQIAVVMHPADALCFQYYQFCLVKCQSVEYRFSDYGQLQAFYAEFTSRLRAGLYGGGVIRLLDGREVSVMPMRRMPRGTALFLVKGWSGTTPNTYGLRLAGMQYNEWWDVINRTVPSASLKYKLVLNGSGVRYEPQDSCSDIEVRYNQRLFSNAAWMQMKITGIPQCNDVVYSTWPALPNLTSYVKCTPQGS